MTAIGSEGQVMLGCDHLHMHEMLRLRARYQLL